MEIFEIMKKHDAWRRGEDPGGKACLRGAKLSKMSFSNNDLAFADFSRADCSGVNFSGANLSGANFIKTDLTGADFSKANLSGADFSGANLCCATFDWTDFSGANFSGAIGVFLLGPLPETGAMCLSVWHTDGWMVKVGPLWLSLLDVKKKAKKAGNKTLMLFASFLSKTQV